MRKKCSSTFFLILKAFDNNFLTSTPNVQLSLRLLQYYMKLLFLYYIIFHLISFLEVVAC